MLNQCNFIGNLGQDPEIRSMNSGDKVANLSIAVTEKWKSKDGERQEKTEWVRIVIFGKLADIAERYLKKGSKVYVSGKMQTRKWQDRDGNDKYTTEVVLQGFGGTLIMLDGRQDGQSQSRDSGSHDAPDNNFDDSQIPF